MPIPVIREATLQDIPLLRQFEQGVIIAERPFDSTLKADPIEYYDIDLLISSPDSQLLVVELEGKPVASGYARIESSKFYHRHTHHAYLGFMYTLPEHRGKGFNQLILQALTDWSRGRGITEIRLEVYPDNQPAIRAYEKAGFSKYMMQMRMGI
jgi:RimJ/RimL family protein N-acetyltransferase